MEGRQSYKKEHKLKSCELGLHQDNPSMEFPNDHYQTELLHFVRVGTLADSKTKKSSSNIRKISGCSARNNKALSVVRFGG